VELAYSSAVELTWDKRITYGPMLQELATRLLEMSDQEGLEPMPQWGEIIPRSEGAQVRTLEADRRMRVVSRQTVAERRGYDWKVEEGRLEEEAEAAAEAAERAFNRGAGEEGGEEPPGAPPE
jgi:hypothetical protein